MRLILYAFLFSCASFSWSQSPCSYTIEGQVLDRENNEPLPYATIQVVGTQNGAISDESGSFIIRNVCAEEIDLEVRFVGYKTVIHHHDFHHPSPIIYLAGDQGLLESVVVEEDLNAHELKTLNAIDVNLGKLDAAGVSAGEIFANTTGVNLLKTGQNISKPIVHGLHSNRVLIINNGVRHAYQAWGTEHGPEIDPTQIDRIRLIKGASTVRYGSEALGGVILFDAPSASFNQKIGGEINGGYETNGRSYNGEFSLSQGFERAAWRASVSAIKQGDLKAPNYQLTNTGKQEFGVSMGARFHFPVVDIDLFASSFNQTLGILRGSVNGNLNDLLNAFEATIPNETTSFSYNINNPKQKTTHQLIRLKASLFLGKQQFDVQYAFQNNLRKEFDVRRGTNNARPAINLKLVSHSLDIDWDHPSEGKWSGTYGIQLQSQDNNNIFGTNTPPFIPNYNIYSAGIFGVESLNIGNTTYEAGLRFDVMNLDVRGRDNQQEIFRNNQSYQSFTFTIGLLKQMNEHVSIRTNLGTAWRAPNIGELYAFGRHQDIIQYGLWRHELFPENDSISTQGILTNEDRRVQNEKGLKWISSVQLNKNNFELEVTPYVHWVRNYFFTRPFGLTSTIRGTFPYFIHDQTDALYTGVDVNIRKKWTGSVETELKAAYVYAYDLENKAAFIGIPPLNIQLAIEKQMGVFKISVMPEWTARQYHAPSVVSPNQILTESKILFETNGTFDYLKEPDGYLLLHAKVAYEKGPWLLQLKGDNLLNNSYRRYTDTIRYFADDPGINVAAHVSYSF